MDLQDSNHLIYGNLNFVNSDGEEINYIATSGCTGWQSHKYLWTRARGAIPSGEYQIPTKPYYSPVKGIEGYFFHITPDPVISPEGVKRGEFGIHFDANVPGSAGCIVLKNREGFNKFCERMELLSIQGVNLIPLKVCYS